MKNHKINGFFKHLSSFICENKALSMLVCVLCFGICGLVSIGNFGGGIVTSLGFSIFAIGLLAQYDRFLTNRIEDSLNSVSWIVAVNSVKVGSIWDADYASIRKMVIFDIRTWCYELLKFVPTLLKTARDTLFALTAVAFWFAVICYLLYPEQFTETSEVLRGAYFQPTICIQLYILMWFMYLAVRIYLSGESSLGDFFGAAIDDRVKRFINFAGDGRVTVYRLQDNDIILPYERAAFRPTNK